LNETTPSTALGADAQLRREMALEAKAQYTGRVYTRPYLSWGSPDLRELSAGGLILSPDRTVAVKFTPERWGSNFGPLTAPLRAGVPPYVELALSNCPSEDDNVYVDCQSDRAFAWQEKNPTTNDHIEDIARRMFTTLEQFGYDFEVAGTPVWDADGYFLATPARIDLGLGGRYTTFA
jgi:hypothetical protein